MLSLAGVSGVRVGLSGRMVDVTYDPSLVSFAAMQEAVRNAGYGLNELPARNRALQVPSWSRVPWGAVAAGIGAAVALAGLYIVVIGIVQDFDHSLSLITGDWYFVIPIVLGFGAQVGLFVYARTALRLNPGTKSTKLFGGAGTGTSTVAMVACCTHHLADALPLLGLSAAAIFLNDYRGPLMALGIISNITGIVWMVRRIRKSRACASVSGAQPSNHAS